MSEEGRGPGGEGGLAQKFKEVGRRQSRLDQNTTWPKRDLAKKRQSANWPKYKSELATINLAKQAASRVGVLVCVVFFQSVKRRHVLKSVWRDV